MTKRASTPSFILELEIGFSGKLLTKLRGIPSVCGDRGLLDRKFNAANAIYNTALNECMRRYHKLQHDLDYKDICRAYGEAVRADDKHSAKLLLAMINDHRSYYGYSEYALHEYIAACKSHYNLLGIDECQKLASRAFAAVEKVRKGEARKVRYHKWNDDTSIEGKSAKSTLKYIGDRCIQFGRGNIFPLIVKKNDHYAEEALKHRVKYVRIVRRTIRGRIRYFAQLVMESMPPKVKNLSYGRADAKVGLDEGTTTLAVASRKEVHLYELAPDIMLDEKRLRVLNRAIDRSLRANNPGNYNEDGTIRKGRKTWVRSKRCVKLEAERRELYRIIADKRKCSHNALANHIVSLGCDIRVEEMRIKALAKRSGKTSVNKTNGRKRSKKRYGRTIKTRAPAMLMTAIDRKLSYIGLFVKKINTSSVKASQYDHKSGGYHKKQLSERWHTFSDGTNVQRDLYSAFLIYNTDDSLETVNRSKCNRNYKAFKVLHDAEVMRIKEQGSNTLRWYVA